MIDAKQAAAKAGIHLRNILHSSDAMVRAWKKCVLGEPVLIRTVDREPSYWIVPAVRAKSVLGYVEVGLKGHILGHSYLSNPAGQSNFYPTTVTRITSDEAKREAANILRAYGGMEIADPVFVHDGPRSRLAWMLEVHSKGQLLTRVFVTPGYAYERKAGESPHSSDARGHS